MSALIVRLRALWHERNPRERWILVIAACVLSLLLVDGLLVTPMQERIVTSMSRRL